MTKRWAFPFFIVPFTLCVFGGCAHCQAPTESSTWQVKKLAVEVSREVLPAPQSDIFVIDPPNSKPRRLVEGISPAWSPNGEKIAYGTRDGRGYGQIYVINADGSARRQLTKVKEGASFPDWSPDGEKIAYTAGLGSKLYTIWVMSKDGESAKQITEGLAARWSPDGSLLAFLRVPKKAGDKGSIWVVNADGTGEKKIRDDDSPSWELIWHPDGKSIAFAADHKSVIFRVNIDGTGLATIASDKRVALFYPIFSPDGLQLIADAFPVGDSHQIPAPALEAGAGNGTVLLVDLTGHPSKVMAHGIHPSVIWAHP